MRDRKSPISDLQSVVPTRRAILRSIVSAQFALVGIDAIAPRKQTGPKINVVADLPELRRSRAGRTLSRQRLGTAEEFFGAMEGAGLTTQPDMFYYSGIVAQLGLSAYLLDVGFDDQWCAKHIGLHVSRALSYANLTGLGCHGEETARLTEVLSPYWKWNAISRSSGPLPQDGGFSAERLIKVLRALLDRVRDVTGHPRRLKRQQVQLAFERSESMPSTERA